MSECAAAWSQDLQNKPRTAVRGLYGFGPHRPAFSCNVPHRAKRPFFPAGL